MNDLTNTAVVKANVRLRENKTETAVREAISGKRRGIRALLPFMGPAFIASIAYMDPGNFATNIQSGSQFGYKMIWVVVLANLMAMLLQNMSAKLGIATGRNLPELCRSYFPKWLNYIMWVFSEIAAMATDIAEFLGATIGLNLLFGIPMLYAALLTGVATYLILTLERLGFRPLEKFISAFVFLIGACYVAETLLSHPDLKKVAYHSVVPWLGGKDSIMLAVGVIGATVMPHAIYLHSSLTQNRIRPRTPDEAVGIHKFHTRETVIALGFAGFVNIAMMYMAASVFYTSGNVEVSTIETAYRTLTPLLGSASAAFFLVSLLASGISSSVVGTMAGQVIMQGFVGFTIPIWLRRIITMLPTVLIIAIGVDSTSALVLSQVVLSIVLPMPVLSLIYFAGRKDVMGILVNKKMVSVLSVISGAVIITLNGWLIYEWIFH